RTGRGAIRPVARAADSRAGAGGAAAGAAGWVVGEWADGDRRGTAGLTSPCTVPPARVYRAVPAAGSPGRHRPAPWQGTPLMSRLVSAALAVSLAAHPLAAQDPPKPDAVERALAVQKAIAAARQHLAANAPAEAVAVLEPRVADADGNRTFLALLRDAYVAELKQLETNPAADPARLAQARRRLNLIGGAAAAAPAAES